MTIMLGSRSTQEMTFAWGIAVAISIAVEFLLAQPVIILIRAAIDVRNRIWWVLTHTLRPTHLNRVAYSLGTFQVCIWLTHAPIHTTGERGIPSTSRPISTSGSETRISLLSILRHGLSLLRWIDPPTDGKKFLEHPDHLLSLPLKLMCRAPQRAFNLGRRRVPMREDSQM